MFYIQKVVTGYLPNAATLKDNYLDFFLIYHLIMVYRPLKYAQFKYKTKDHMIKMKNWL